VQHELVVGEMGFDAAAFERLRRLDVVPTSIFCEAHHRLIFHQAMAIPTETAAVTTGSAH
jgi:hypothetical protein